MEFPSRAELESPVSVSYSFILSIPSFEKDTFFEGEQCYIADEVLVFRWKELNADVFLLKNRYQFSGSSEPTTDRSEHELGNIIQTVYVSNTNNFLKPVCHELCPHLIILILIASQVGMQDNASRLLTCF